MTHIHTYMRTFFAHVGVGGSPDRRPSAAPAIAGDLRPGAPSCRVPPGVVAFRYGTSPQEDTMSSTTPTVAQIETAAQAAADAAYNAVHAVLSAHTAPGVVIVQPETPAAPLAGLFAAPVAAPEVAPVAAPVVAPVIMPTAQVTAQAGAGWEPADTYAAFRTWQGITSAAWKAYDTAAKAQIRGAQVAPFCRVTQKGDTVAAAAAFGAQAAPVVAQAAQAAAAPAQAAPVTITLPGMGQTAAATAAPKPQPVGTVALNGAKMFAKAAGLPIPTNGDAVDSLLGAGVMAALKAHVTQERNAGHAVTAHSIALWITEAAAK